MSNPSLSFLSKALILSVLTAAVSTAAVIYDVSGLTLTGSSLTQTGRLSRTGVPSDWSASKAFPGAVNTATSYRYNAYVLPTSPFPYLQISFFDESGQGSTFMSAYLNAYTPNSLAPNFGLNTNYLGDAGGSGNPAGNPTTFQIVLSNLATDRLVLVVNDATGAGAFGLPFDILVEGFYDTNFNDTKPVVPEPGTIFLSGAGLLAAAILTQRRRS